MKKEEVKRNTYLGIFVVTSIIIFLLAIFLLGSEQSLFHANFSLRANFTDVNGLQKGNNVWLAGVKIGTVDDVSIIDDATVQVSMRIQEDLHEYIKTDAIATISSEGFVGNTIVVITPGNSGEIIAENGILSSGRQTSTQDMLKALQSTANNIGNITDELRNLMENSTQPGTMGYLLTDTTLGQEIKLAIDNIETTGRRSSSLAADLRQMVNEIQQNEEGMVSTLINDTTFASTYEETLTNIRTAGETAAKASAELNQLVDKLDNSNNAAGVVLNDTAFAKNIKETAAELSEGMEKFNENMEAVRHNFLFRRYFKKKRRQEERED